LLEVTSLSLILGIIHTETFMVAGSRKLQDYFRIMKRLGSYTKIVQHMKCCRSLIDLVMSF
jgi:hypothetical protein